MSPDIGAMRAEYLEAFSEKQLEAAVRARAQRYGLLRYHTYRSIKSPSGFPDEVLVGQRVLFRELKKETTRLTTPQEEWGDRLTSAGADWDVWRPSDLVSGRIDAEMLDAAGGPR